MDFRIINPHFRLLESSTMDLSEKIEKRSIEKEKFRFIALMEESRQIRLEILRIQTAMRNLTYYSLLISGGLSTFTMTFFKDFKEFNFLISIGFLIIPVTCFILLLNYLGLSRNLLHISNYHVIKINPNVVRITETELSPLFQWMIHIRKKRKSIVGSIGYLLKFISELLIILVPAIFSLLIFTYSFITYSNGFVPFVFIIDSLYLSSIFGLIIWFYKTSRESKEHIG